MKQIKLLSAMLLCLLCCFTSCNKDDDDDKGTITLTVDQDTIYMNAADSTQKYLTGEIKTTNDYIKALTVKYYVQGADISSFALAMTFTTSDLSDYYYAFTNNNLVSGTNDYRKYIPYIKKIELTAISIKGLTETKEIPVVIK